MNGVFGLIDDRVEQPVHVVQAMARTSDPQCTAQAGRHAAVASVGHPGTSATITEDDVAVALQGHAWWAHAGRRITAAADVARAFLDAWRRDGAGALGSLHGAFAVAVVAPRRQHALLAVDRMSIRNIVYARTRGGLAFAATCDALARVPGVALDVDPQAIFDYLYFHMVPGPATAFRDVMRVPPGHFVAFDAGKLVVGAHWRPRFVEGSRRGFAALKHEFRSALEDGVAAAAGDAHCGAFLSGGTDSSTIAGLLGRVTGSAPSTFSIGFDASGYDETAYARIAARHFGAVQHEYYVTPADVVEAVPRIALAYDQPFGNASAVPTYHCARLAAGHGITRLLAGDGGDELFGGNARYARQAQFAHFDRLPAPVRERIQRLAQGIPAGGHVALLRRARSYVAQASQPMPDRYDSYNLLERLGVASILSDEFLATVDATGPRTQMRAAWAGADAGSLVNRMLALDFKYTLADNDLPKVTRMCELAGVDVSFPMLHDPVIDFSLVLPPDHKLRGTTLRWFFKRALADFLPRETIAKEKHGFGLPVGVWLQQYAPLRDLAGDSLAGLAKRGIVRPAFLRDLIDRRLAEHAGYYGTMVWVLMMLEMWFRSHDRLRAPSSQPAPELGHSSPNPA